MNDFKNRQKLVALDQKSKIAKQCFCEIDIFDKNDPFLNKKLHIFFIEKTILPTEHFYHFGFLIQNGQFFSDFRNHIYEFATESFYQFFILFLKTYFR